MGQCCVSLDGGQPRKRRDKDKAAGTTVRGPSSGRDLPAENNIVTATRLPRTVIITNQCGHDTALPLPIPPVGRDTALPHLIPPVDNSSSRRVEPPVDCNNNDSSDIKSLFDVLQPHSIVSPSTERHDHVRSSNLSVSVARILATTPQDAHPFDSPSARSTSHGRRVSSLNAGGSGSAVSFRSHALLLTSPLASGQLTVPSNVSAVIRPCVNRHGVLGSNSSGNYLQIHFVPSSNEEDQRNSADASLTGGRCQYVNPPSTAHSNLTIESATLGSQDRQIPSLAMDDICPVIPDEDLQDDSNKKHDDYKGSKPRGLTGPYSGAELSPSAQPLSASPRQTVQAVAIPLAAPPNYRSQLARSTSADYVSPKAIRVKQFHI